ncbi:MAG: MFS transporter [Alphaproteobacteria bacterium]
MYSASSTHAVELDGRYSWLRLAVTVALAAISGIGMWSVILVLPEVQKEFSVDRSLASVPYTVTMVGYAFGNALFGRMVDRFGATTATIASALTLGAGFALAALTANVWQFAAVQAALIGLGSGAGFGPLVADASHWFQRRRGIAMSLVASGNFLAGVVWPLGLKDVLQTDGWRSAYFIIAVACIAGMVPLALLLRRKPPHDHDGSGAPNRAARPLTRSIDLSPRALQWLLFAAGIGCCVAMSMPQVHIVAYCGDLGYGVAVGAEMLSLMLAGGIASRLVSGFLADYIGGVRTLLLGSVLQCLALFLYLPFDGLTSLYVVSLIFGLSQGGIVPAYAIIVREYLPAHEAGRRVGLVIMATVIGMAFGGWLSGWIFDLTGSYRAAFLNGIGWNLFNIAIMLSILWRTRGPRTASA